MQRRSFLAAALASAIAPIRAHAARSPRVLLRSSWQTVNIGVAEMLLARFPKLRILRGAEAVQ